MTISIRNAKIMLATSIVVAAVIYLVMAETLSETQMVRIAYLWVPLAVTGAAIWFTRNTTLKFAVIVALSTFAALLKFFVVIFPML